MFVGIYPQAIRLCAYQWPGNVAELRNVIERAVKPFLKGKRSDCSICRAKLRCSRMDNADRAAVHCSAPAAIQHPLSETTGPEQQDEIRRITEALERHGNNRRRARRSWELAG